MRLRSPVLGTQEQQISNSPGKKIDMRLLLGQIQCSSEFAISKYLLSEDTLKYISIQLRMSLI